MRDFFSGFVAAIINKIFHLRESRMFICRRVEYPNQRHVNRTTDCKHSVLIAESPTSSYIHHDFVLSILILIETQYASFDQPSALKTLMQMRCTEHEPMLALLLVKENFGICCTIKITYC